MGTSSKYLGQNQKENGVALKEPSTQNNFAVLSIPEEPVLSVLEEGEVPLSPIQLNEEVRISLDPALKIPVEGHSPTYAEMEKKRKPIDNFGSSEEDPLEKSSKKGKKSQKTVREEEFEHLKMQGIHPTIEMSITRNTRARGGPNPSVK